jgi:hypothetical protein
MLPPITCWKLSFTSRSESVICADSVSGPF